MEHNNFVIENDTLVEYIGDDSEIIIPEGVKIIGKYACNGFENLKTVIIPEGVIVIDSSAFSECDNLEKVILPESLKYIGDESFAFNGKLKKIKIPQGVECVLDTAFLGCNGIEIEAFEEFKLTPLFPEEE